MLKGDGMQHVVSASLLASSFFCAFIGVVFFVIGNADVPRFKVVDTVPPESLKEEKLKGQKIKAHSEPPPV